MCCCAGELPREPGTQRQQGGNKSTPGSPNTRTDLPTLSTEIVELQGEGGKGAVVLESFSESLARKGHKEAISPHQAPQTLARTFPPSAPRLLNCKARVVRVLLCWRASARAWHTKAKEAKSTPGSPNTHMGLPTLSTDFIAPHVEGG